MAREYTEASTAPDAAHDPLHPLFVAAHCNLFGSTPAKARAAIAAIYRRDYRRDPPPTKPLTDPAMISAVEGAMLTLPPRHAAAIRRNWKPSHD